MDRWRGRFLFDQLLLIGTTDTIDFAFVDDKVSKLFY